MNAYCTNNFNFLEEKNILLITEDKELINDTKYLLYENTKDFEQVSSILNITNYSKFDLIIVDIDSNELSIVSSILETSAKDIPIIFITSKLDNSILHLSENIKLKNIVIKNVNTNLLKYYIALVLKESSIINFNDGYYFNTNKEEFFCNKKLVKLTSLEIDLFKYLLNNKNRVVTYDEIKKNVWHNKKFTIYGMRNIINKIREKSYYDIINNVPKIGYVIKNYHIIN